MLRLLRARDAIVQDCAAAARRSREQGGGAEDEAAAVGRTVGHMLDWDEESGAAQERSDVEYVTLGVLAWYAAPRNGAPPSPTALAGQRVDPCRRADPCRRVCALHRATSFWLTLFGGW